MANIMMCFPNFADPDYFAPVLSGGNWLPALPLANLQDPLLSRVARSADATRASARLHADLIVSRDVRAVVIPKHNLSRAAAVRTRASDRPAWGGATLAASATAGATSLTVQRPGGSAMIRAGDAFRLPGDPTLYAFTGSIGLGGNRLRDSEDLAGPWWSAPVGAAVVANQAVAPDGTNTADLLRENSAGGPHYQWNPAADLLIAPGAKATSSVFVRPRGNRHLRLEHNDGADSVRADFDLAAGAVASTFATAGGILHAAGVAALPGGWFRCWLTAQIPASPGLGPDFRHLILSPSLGVTYLGDGASGLLLWGKQVEAGAASVYKRSGAASASETASGSVGISPALAADASSGAALACLSGEYVSTAPAYDSGRVEPFPIIYPFGSLPWGHPSFWDGRLAEEERRGYPQPILHLAPTTVNARYWLIEVDDQANSDGHIDLARLFIARAWQPSRNYAYGAQLGWRDDSTELASDGGAEFYAARPTRRTYAFRVEYLPLDEAMVSGFEMLRKLGKAGQLFVLIDPGDDRHAARRSFLATMTSPQPIEHAAYNLHSFTAELREVIA
ncbi:phage head spike fiber domain-containing protein [Paludisphaera rhizosphaerae]|uniref:phage head spike fiber domain-containing protein n=1 Tax=Paludisphaera rhizosphaerae TaxID=2711216 RepID=UPI0013EA7608|nr:hypothetical protein [Paludisphaera rhizosphaerae]